MARKQPPPAAGSLSEDIKGAVREGREFLKDLQKERKEIEELLNKGTAAMVDEAMARQIGILGESAKKAMDKSVAKIYQNFDRLEATLLGTTREARKSGEKSTPQIMNILGNRRRMVAKITEAEEDPDTFRKVMLELADETDCTFDIDGHCDTHGWYADDPSGRAQECPIEVAKEMKAQGMFDPTVGGIDVTWQQMFMRTQETGTLLQWQKDPRSASSSAVRTDSLSGR